VANELFGVARCQGNQALINRIRGRIEETQALLQQLEMLSHRIDDVEGLTFAWFQQAALRAGPLGQPGAALPLAEQAQRLATEHRLTPLANGITPLVEHIRSQLQEP
jgi:hypothetical protein